jgi:hypothetical protein
VVYLLRGDKPMQQEIYAGFGRHLLSTNFVSVAVALVRFVIGAVFKRRELRGVAAMQAPGAIDILVVDESQMAPAIDITVVDEAQFRI